ELFDGLVRGAVFAEADGVVCEDVDDLHVRERGESYGGLHVVGEAHEGRAEGDESAVETHARQGRAHPVLAYAEVKYAPLVRAGLEAAAFTDVSVGRGAEVCRAADERRHVRRERVDDFAARLTRRHRLRVGERG